MENDQMANSSTAIQKPMQAKSKLRIPSQISTRKHIVRTSMASISRRSKHPS